MILHQEDEYFMKEAIKEAQKAFDENEIPVGAVVVAERRIIARTHNQTEMLKDVTAHAEILAIGAASQAIGSKYLPECTLYITLEPCLMCAGALAWSQIGRIVWGASDEKQGFLKKTEKALHPKTLTTQGVLAHECGQILKDFFLRKR